MAKKHSKGKKTKFWKTDRLNKTIRGYITIYEGSAEYKADFKGQPVTFSLWGCGNNTVLRDNLPFFRNVVDNYENLNTMAKEAIIEHYRLKDINVRYYFHEIFEFMKYVGKHDHIKTFGVDDFEKVDIKTVVEKMNCYYLSIDYKNNMDIDLSYLVSDGDYYNEKHLVAVMDKRFAVKRFFSVLD
jgi:hypothetical protein